MLLNIFIWLVIGGLSGWIGFLITKPHLRTMGLFVGFGILGGIIGGLLAEAIDIADSKASLDPMSLIFALVLSIFFVFLYVVFSSSKKQK